jgi:hypothetical protein
VGYHDWPPDPPEPSHDGPGRWPVAGDAPHTWPPQSDRGYGPGPPPAHQWYGSGGRDDATVIYPAVPSRGHPPGRQEPQPAAEPVDGIAWTPALLWTAGFFVVPVLLYLVWAATRSGTAPVNCIDATGAVCASPRAAALSGLAGLLPGLAGALALAMLAMVGLRRIATNWRAGTVGFAAGVIGAGAATMIAGLFG